MAGLGPTRLAANCPACRGTGKCQACQDAGHAVECRICGGGGFLALAIDWQPERPDDPRDGSPPADLPRRAARSVWWPADWQPGTRLSALDLQRRLGIGYIAARELGDQLVVDGVLANRGPMRGTYVVVGACQWVKADDLQA